MFGLQDYGPVQRWNVVTDVISVEDQKSPSAAASIEDVASGKTTVFALVSAALARAEEVEDLIQAFCWIDRDAAVEGSEVIDCDGRRPLKGLVIGVKDVIDTADMPTTYGSPLFADYRPARDAEIVATLRRLGGFILGKTCTTEFAMFEPTRTRNPVDLRRTPGGSSSGSAAAVAAGVLPVALGTQTAGSVVRPAAYCGIFGFKPSKGWTSTTGILPLAGSLDTPGILARKLEDLRLVYQALRFPTRKVLRTQTELHSVAVLAGTEWGPVEPEVLEVLAEASSRLRARGITVVDLRMPAEWIELPARHETVMVYEVARCLRQLLGERVVEISPSSLSTVERGDATSRDEYDGALEAARQATGVLEHLRSRVEVLLAPSALGVAPEGLEFTGDPIMCRPWTLLGLPAANLPSFRTGGGLPIGIQAVSVSYDDLRFLGYLSILDRILSS